MPRKRKKTAPKDPLAQYLYRAEGEAFSNTRLHVAMTPQDLMGLNLPIVEKMARYWPWLTERGVRIGFLKQPRRDGVIGQTTLSNDEGPWLIDIGTMDMALGVLLHELAHIGALPDQLWSGEPPHAASFVRALSLILRTTGHTPIARDYVDLAITYSGLTRRAVDGPPGRLMPGTPYALTKGCTCTYIMQHGMVAPLVAPDCPHHGGQKQSYMVGT